MAWRLLDSDGDWTKEMHRATYMVDSATDIATPPEENSKLEFGSIAYTADFTGMWQKDGSGNWVKVGG